MQISVIPIGNSRGIRIPKSILQQLHIDDKVELEVHDTELLIRPVINNPRKGWKDAFSEMHKNGDDKLLISETQDQDDFQWEW